MSMSNHYERGLLRWELTNVALTRIATLGGMAATSPAGTLYFALHETDPGEDGVQSTGEASYAGYARVGIARDAANWDIPTPTGVNPTEATLQVDIDFPQYLAGGDLTFNYWSLGTSLNNMSNDDQILRKGQFASPLVVPALGIPQIPAGDLVIRQD